MSDARKHHYIPQFYLGGFTPTGSKEDQLHVLDTTACRRWLSPCKDVACERDFYRVDGAEPNKFEDLLERIETDSAPVVKEVLKSRALPVGKDLGILMGFLSVLAVRGPDGREFMDEPVKTVSKKIAGLILETPERWEKQKSELVAKGVISKEEADAVSYEEMKRFQYGEAYDIEVDQSWHIGNIFPTAEAIYPCLVARKWTVYVSEQGGFICSDNPVALLPEEALPEWMGPGFGMAKTQVSVALGKNVAIVGKFEGSAGIVQATPKQVATINTRTSYYAERLFSPNADFSWLGKNSTIRDADALLATAKERAAKQS